MIDILDIKIGGKFSNNGDSKLTGGIGSRKTVEIDFIVHWEAIDFDGTFFDNYITSNDGTDFILKGFKVGDTVTVITDGSSQVNDGNYTIGGLSNNTMWLLGTGSGSGSGAASFTTQVGVTISVHGTTPVKSIDYLFGLNENSVSSPQYVSLIDAETQKYRKDGLDADAGNTYQLDPFTVNKSWVSGTTAEKALTTIEEKGIGNSGASYGYEQWFKITHVYHVTPEILDGWEDANGDIDVTLVSWFNGVASLKFIPKIIAGFTTGSSEHSTDNGNLSIFLQNGDVGFYDEYRNGGPANYTKGSVTYTSSSGETISQLSQNDETNVSIIINKVSGSFNDESHFDIYVFELPDDPADYSNNTNDVWTNFEVSNVFINPLSAAAAHNKISNADAAYIGSQATISFDFAASGNDKRYIIFIDTGGLFDDEADTDHHPVLIDYNEFEIYIDVREILRFTDCLINEHSSNDTNRAFTDYKGWVEDGLLITFPFDVKRLVGAADDYTCTLTSVKLSIDAEHQTDDTRNFNLEEVELDIPDNDTRDFLLPTGDPKNYKKFNELTGDVDYRKYLLELATKLRWEEWVTQGNADTDFTTPTANWSTYDLPPDWFIYANVVITCSMINSDAGITETYERTHKIRVRIKNYEEYEGCEKLGEIQTLRPSDDTDLNGQLLLNNPTKVKGIFTGNSLFPCIYEEVNSGSGSITCEDEQIVSGSGSASYSSGEDVLANCPEYYGILEIDIPVTGGPNIIHQISTLFDATESGTPWVGPMATNKAKLVAYPFANPPRIEVIANLDNTLLDNTVPQYKLTARLGRQAETICKVSIMGEAEPGNTITNSGIDGFTLDELLVFNDQQELTSDPASSVTGDTFSANQDLVRGYKVCCSKDAIIGSTNPSGEFTHASLIGMSSNDFLVFAGSTGFEYTTRTSFTFNSGTGTIGGLPAGDDIKISFHTSFITTVIISSNSLTTNLIIGYAVQDVMIIINGREMTHLGATISGNVITLPATLTGNVKICKVNQ